MGISNTDRTGGKIGLIPKIPVSPGGVDCRLYRLRRASMDFESAFTGEDIRSCPYRRRQSAANLRSNGV